MAFQKQKEVDCTRDVLAFLLRMGCYAWRNNTGVMKSGGRYVRFGKTGSGDILGILPNGRFLSIEIKSNGEPVTEKQKEFREMVESCSGVALIVRNLDEVVEYFESMKWNDPTGI